MNDSGGAAAATKHAEYSGELISGGKIQFDGVVSEHGLITNTVIIKASEGLAKLPL